MIKVEKAEIELSETTVRSLLVAIKKAKDGKVFLEEPMPKGDMSVYQYKLASRERGNITISSPHSGITYKVRVETRPFSQESLGYELDELPEPEKLPTYPEGTTIFEGKAKEND